MEQANRRPRVPRQAGPDSDKHGRWFDGGVKDPKIEQESETEYHPRLVNSGAKIQDRTASFQVQDESKEQVRRSCDISRCEGLFSNQKEVYGSLATTDGKK
jgi:hypothetical protein